MSFFNRVYRLWKPFGSRVFALSLMSALTLGLSGCLVSEELVDLGPRAQPLKPGLYASFDGDGDPEHAVVMHLTRDGRYKSEDFDVALYQSGIAPDVFFMAYVDDETDRVLYGVARVEMDALAYTGVVCDMVPETAREAIALGKHEDGCLIETPEKGRAVLTALWHALPGAPNPSMKSWTRFVRQTEFRR